MKDNHSAIKLQDDPQEQPPVIASGGILNHLRVSLIATVILTVICCGIYPLIVWGLSQAMFHDQANGSLITDSSGAIIGSKLIGQSFSATRYFHPRPSAAGSGYDPTSSGGSNLGPTSAKLINGTTKPTTMPAPRPTDPPVSGPDAVDYDGIKLRLVNYCSENNIAFELLWVQKDADGRELLTVADKKVFITEKGEIDAAKLVTAFNDGTRALTVKAGEQIPADAVTASASGLDPHISPENAMMQLNRVADARKMSAQAVKQLIENNTDGRALGFLGEKAVNVLALNLALDQIAPVSPTTAPTTRP
jgi:K+-transporting ATPase ATPase C chain